ncbi:hypothetical protein [Eikenella halliae]|nr:hypothetical protein [Eikenella halliae]
MLVFSAASDFQVAFKGKQPPALSVPEAAGRQTVVAPARPLQ